MLVCSECNTDNENSTNITNWKSNIFLLLIKCHEVKSIAFLSNDGLILKNGPTCFDTTCWNTIFQIEQKQRNKYFLFCFELCLALYPFPPTVSFGIQHIQGRPNHHIWKSFLTSNLSNTDLDFFDRFNTVGFVYITILLFTLRSKDLKNMIFWHQICCLMHNLLCHPDWGTCAYTYFYMVLSSLLKKNDFPVSLWHV